MVTEKELNHSDEVLRKCFARVVTEKLKERRMTMFQLSKEAAVNYITIRNLIDCKDCKRSTMSRVARVLDISIMII